MPKQKSGEVIRILSNESLLISVGSNKGAYVKEKFEIYEPGEPIYHPKTGEKLGNLDYVKCTVEITQLFPNFSIVQNITRTSETRTINALSAFANSTKTLTTKHVNTLNIQEKEIQPQQVKQRKITINDCVRAIDWRII